MKLLRYLAERGISETAFARESGLDQRTINRIVKGQEPTASTALRIIRASRRRPAPRGGTVSLEDLVLNISAVQGAA